MDLPIGRPGKIIGVGRNYKNHVKELDHDIPELPLFFCKATSSLIATDQPIIIPEWLDTRVDHEAELAVIISKQGRSISEADAMDYVAGFTILNDVTARDIQKEDVNSAHPWFRSKSMDTFCPVGPGITPADQDLDPHNLDIVLTVNGEIRQKNNTKNMIFTIPQIIAEISKYMTLLPGDIIATGTPEGVGPIYNGDIIEIKITGLGTLTNKVGL
ncbi:fumarylacetoacetate hydrolase family protein [bacterium]|nr:fumarylacetoacetate hydrolase family protein [bacterium]